MAQKAFVDTNILIYAHDLSAGIKRERARDLVDQLWNTGTGVLSIQVLQEFCVNLRRRVSPPLPAEEVRSLIRDYLTWEVVVNRADSVLSALDLEARFKISFWDALILHAAENSGATILYSEELSPGQQYGAIRVVNPLLGSSRPL